jgi:hypothetical protein
MATIIEGILGAFSGKVGPVVGVINQGKFYMRARPRKKNTKSPGELENEMRFKMIIDHLHPIKPLVRAGFKGYYTRTGGYRGAFAYNRQHALVADDGGIYIDPALFRISGGDLPVAESPAVSLVNDQLEFTWDVSGNAEGNHSDQMMMLVYDVQNSRTLERIFDGPFRSAGSYQLPVPLGMKGSEADIYVGFIAADRSAQSESQYLGRILL